MALEQWSKVEEFILHNSDRQTLSAIFNVLLTIEERDAIGSRLAIMRALLDGKKTQRTIAEELGVSIAKVTRCANNLKTLSHSNKELLKG